MVISGCTKAVISNKYIFSHILFLADSSYHLQLPETVKREVPEEIREKAREMARQELLRRLEELDMSEMEAKGYGQLLQATQSHMLSLFDLLESAFLRLQNVIMR